MQSPVEITFRDIPSSPAIHAHVEKRIAKLESFFDGITKCHVVLESAHRHSKNDKRYTIRIDLHVPGKEVVVTNDDEETTDLFVAIDDAFADIERNLEDYLRKGTFDTKTHLKPPRGVVAKVFPDRGYGFIETEDGREVYFHRNSLLGAGFDKLALGTKVRFAEEDGDKGPQASTVHILGGA
jgi:ribosomal subunit interface protein